MLFKYDNAVLEFREDVDEYIVQSGSVINTAYSISDSATSAIERRARVDRARHIAKRMGWNGSRILNQNVLFPSASSAADFVAGDWRSGTQVWKNSRGQTLGEYKDRQQSFKRTNPSLYDKVLRNIATNTDDEVVGEITSEGTGLSEIIATLEALSNVQPPERVERIVSKIVRNPKIALLIKKQQEYICEVCGREPFRQKTGTLYAEADHIKPLGLGGLDTPENMRCLCAQCHAVITHGSDELIKELLSSSKWQP